MKFRMFLTLTTITFAGLLASRPNVHAGPAPFGGELTFTNDALLNASSDMIAPGDVRIGFFNRAKLWYQEYCKHHDCTVLNTVNDYSPEFRVTFKDEWYFVVNLDPRVIEVQTKPEALDSLIKREAQIQDAIFDGLKSCCELRPHKTIGGGHHNIGFAGGFESDLRLVANFITDLANHPALEQRFFTDPISAPSFALLPKEALRNYEVLVSEVFSGKLSDPKEFSKRLTKDVYSKGILASYQRPQKYQAVSVMSFEELVRAADRVEIRNVSPQANAREFILQCRLYQARIDYITSLTRNGGKLPLVIAGAYSKAQRDAQLYYFITDTGLNFDEFRGLYALPASSAITKNREFAFRPAGFCSDLLHQFQKVIQYVYLLKH